MTLLVAVLTVDILGTAAFACWAIHTLRRLRVSVNLAHDDLSEMAIAQFERRGGA